jgi:O-antigen/teichoic acid export membrane protein
MKYKLLEVGKHSLIYGASSGFQGIIGLLFLPLLTAYFSTSEFGVYSLLLLISTLSSTLFFFGASSIVNRYFFETDTQEYRNGIVTTTFSIAVLGAILQFLLALIFKEELSTFLIGDVKYSNHMLLVLTSGSVGMIMNYNLVILRIEKKSVYYVLINVISNLINIGIAYTLFKYLKYDLYAPILGVMAANSISLILSYPVVHKYLCAKIDRKAFVGFLFFGFSTTISGFSYYFLDWIDRYFIKEYASISDVGIYSLGYKIGMLIHILMIIPFSMIWATLRMQNVKNEDNRLFVSKIISYFTIIGLIMVIFTLLFSKEILPVFSRNEDFNISYKIVPIIMFAHLTYGYINIVDYGIYLTKKLHFYIIILLIAAGINGCLNYLLIPIYGYMAAAYITLFTYIFCTTLIYYISNKFYKLKVEFVRSVLPYLFVLILLIVNSSISPNWSVFAKILLFISILIAVFVFWLDNNEKMFLKSLINSNKNNI